MSKLNKQESQSIESEQHHDEDTNYFHYQYNQPIQEEKSDDSSRINSNNKLILPANQLENIQQPIYVEQNLKGGGKYIGYKVANKKEGKGKLYFKDGGYYQGNFTNNKINGYGKLYYDNNQLAYQGQWLNDQFSGKGKIFNDQPQQLLQPFDPTNFIGIMDKWIYYEGQFQNNMKNGKGKIQFTNGELFEGNFIADIVEGYGIFTQQDGTSLKGYWKQNIYFGQNS